MMAKRPRRDPLTIVNTFVLVSLVVETVVAKPSILGVISAAGFVGCVTFLIIRT